jgi:hypothetical protein
MILFIIGALLLVLAITVKVPDYRVIPSTGPGEVRFDGRGFRRVFRTTAERAQWMEELKAEQKKIIEELRK